MSSEKRETVSGTAVSYVYWLSLGVIFLALIIQLRAHRMEERMSGILSHMLERQLSSERLLGTVFPTELQAAVAAGDKKGTYSLYWIVDVDDCRDCTVDVSHWNVLASADAIDAVVMIAGSDEAEVQKLRRHVNGDHSTMERISRDEIADNLGFSFPSLRVLLDESGEILSVNATRPNALCRWSYPAHIARLTGVPLSDPLPLRFDIQS